MEFIRRFRAQIIIAILALAVIGVLLVGQQPGGEGAGPAPLAGGQYVEGLVGYPNRFNPLLDANNQVDRDIDRLVFSSLFKFDSYGSPQPDLVEDWGVSATGDVVNITLRQDAVWHDGTPVTTRDVLFTIGLMRLDDSPTPEDLRNLWKTVEVTAFDDYNMQFDLGEAYAPFFDYLDFGILPEHLLAGKDMPAILNGPFNISPVGSGPYRFEELLIEDGRIDGVVLAANEEYYKDGPFIQQIVFRFYDSTAQALEAFRAGEILGIGTVDEASLLDVLAEPGLNVYTGRLPQLTMVLFNLKNDSLPFFQDAEVRRALLTGLNRPWMIAETLHGQGIVADAVILPGSWAYYDAIPSLVFDREDALEALRAADYLIPAEGGAVREKDGVRMAFDLAHPDTPRHAAQAEMIRGYWAELGVQVNLVAVDYETLLAEYLEPRTFEAALVDLDMTGSPDPDPYPFWHQSQATGGQNYAGWDDRRASEYLEKARVSVYSAERIRLYRNFQVHFGRELPALPLYYPVYNYAVSALVQGVSIGSVYDPSDRFNDVNTWFLVAQSGASPTEPSLAQDTPTP
ncbi:MAG: peptide ABC transporter substrate-binding protein [Chloroflexi bacterium]|nr:peptide ABC transporter substrate-binding protein [Chloroflexota bacterium]